MRVLILTDESFALRERALLSRLEVGLVAEGVRVVQAVPGAIVERLAGGLESEVVGYEEGGPPFLRGEFARRLARRVGASEGNPDGGSLDLIHCLGESCWPLAAALARRTGASLVYEVWSGSLLRRARRLARGDPVERGAALFVPDASIGAALRAAVPAGSITITPWGVHTPGGVGSCAAREPDAAIAVAMLASGGDPAGVLAALDGVARVASAHPGLLLFIDAHAAERTPIWSRARALDLLDRVSIVGDAEAQREPILHADLLIQPESLGEHRSLCLDAMACGMAVVARADPLVEHLIDGRTAVLVGRPSAAAWAEAVGALLADPARAAALGRTARAFIREHRTGHVHVESVLAAYERVVSGAATAEDPGRVLA